ncbi:hypothetical protein RAB80_009818 [Fusarium oxysporum f. sp. vasinfectum]|uniref:Uncharacterized protein n=2 Tax=Fusarium oxysporum TaxID=5507 RepID=X0L7A2_FUSOX|nr:hypothetical protein FOVG_14788 [Fusarium oxysporum f. sp. pisi HDV247]EXM16932.1 hypothetical protein FOTG_14824 [Fusarium oxysporum f. sp. vasinfectum 25433]KAK2674834.1 hypothetical protein RAB80_009818 [Fusarium oxysporum f. sp. vasinfectum]KAK2931267.1 hypothetical protein FoTM2_008777 [Fusarium oxysporum f. sp. vasinfectum]WKT51329.1 hypothetical protein QSH57_016299 [Fusarium oxysporum f. sp. vasinfectum]
MSENNNIRPYLMPALRETPSSQLAVQRRPLPSSAPKRLAAQTKEDANRESPSTPPRRAPRRNARGKKVAGRPKNQRDEEEKNSPPSPSTPSLAFPKEYAVATHCTVIPGHGHVYYAEDHKPLFVPTAVMHVHHTPDIHTCPCHQAPATGLVPIPGMQMPSIGAMGRGYGGEQGWNENTWGYVPGFELGDTSQIHGGFNFNRTG